MSTPTITKCPLTGLDMWTQTRNLMNYYHSEIIPQLEYGLDIYSVRRLQESDCLTASQKGKLIRWVYENTVSDKLIEIPENYVSLNYKETDSPLNQIITPAQKLDWLLEYLYHDMEDLGQQKTVTNTELFPIVATIEPARVWHLIQALEKEGYLEQNTTMNGSITKNTIGYKFLLATTLEGFKAYEDYKKGKAHSNFGFMALKFSTDTYNSPADEIYKNYWKKAVEEAGYPLHALYEKEKSEAGNINNIMEANIRKCKFLIADVTPPEDTDTPNPNVMWEAGFAEGLNKPVFYVCDKNKKPKKRVFDIDHHKTLYYDGSNEEQMKEDCEELKATIFNTFAQKAQ